MKKLGLLLMLLLLSSCSEKYYMVTIGEQNISVGKDNIEVINNDKITYKTFADKKGKQYISEVAFLLEDVKEAVKIDDYELTKGVKESCVELEGEYNDDLIPTCLIHKNVKGRENIIILRGNILADDSDVIDNLSISYDFKEDD